VESILTEVLKINDSYHQTFETNPRNIFAYQHLLENRPTDPWDDFWRLADCTVIGKPKLATAPLPMLEDDDEEEEEEDERRGPKFESIEEAGKFFAKNSGAEWVW
jgi:hypothetical protein